VSLAEALRGLARLASRFPREAYDRAMDFFDLDPIGWALLGFLAGGLSSWLIRGRAARGCLANILVGILGGLIGGTLAKSTGFGDAGGFLGSLFVALLGSVLLRLAIEFVDRRPRR